MFSKLKARKHANAISTETARLLIKKDSPDQDIALADIAYLWGWFEAIDICVFNINEKMDRNLTWCFLLLANSIDSSCVHEMMQTRMETAMDLVTKTKDNIGSSSIIPLFAQYGANYLQNNGYGAEEDMFLELLEAVKRISKTI